MAEIFKFFNSAPGDERWHYASDFADYFGDVLSSGLIHKNNVPGLQVKVVSNSLKTVVDAGQALIKGYSYQNTTSLELTHNITEVGLNRIDRIVLRLDLRNANRFIKLFVREGEEAVTPVAPDLQRDQYIYELSLAQVKITSNSTIIDALSLVDERLKEEVCGIVYSLISVPTSVFQQQFDTWFNSQKSIYTDDLNAWTTNQKALFESWRDSEVALFSDWKINQENEFVDWRTQQQSDFQTWQTKEQSDFEAWFASLENILDENTAATLVNKTNNLEQGVANVIEDLNTHKTNETAHGIGDKTKLLTTEKTNLVGAVNELFTDVDNGKKQIANAIVDKNGTASSGDSFTQLAIAIGGLGGGVKSVQSGKVKPTTPTTDITISKVDTNKTIVLLSPYQTLSNNTTASDVSYAKLINSNTLSIKKGFANGVQSVFYQIIEFYGVKSLQRGEVSSLTSAEITVAVNEVDINKTILLVDFLTTAASTLTLHRGLNYSLINNNTIGIQGYATDKMIYWQLIEFN